MYSVIFQVFRRRPFHLTICTLTHSSKLSEIKSFVYATLSLGYSGSLFHVLICKQLVLQTEKHLTIFCFCLQALHQVTNMTVALFSTWTQKWASFPDSWNTLNSWTELPMYFQGVCFYYYTCQAIAKWLFSTTMFKIGNSIELMKTTPRILFLDISETLIR